MTSDPVARPSAAWSALVAALLTLAFGSLLTFLAALSRHEHDARPAAVVMLSCVLACAVVLVPIGIVLGAWTARGASRVAERFGLSLRLLAAGSFGLAGGLSASLLGRIGLEEHLASLPGIVAVTLAGLVAGLLVAMAVERGGMPVGAAAVASLVAAFVVYQALLGLLLFNGFGPVVIYRSRSIFAQVMFFAERIAFVPTYWLTKPLGGVAARGGWLSILTFGELVFLAALYALLFFLVLRRTLTATMRRAFRGHAWMPLAIIVALFLIGLVMPGGTTP